MYKIQYKSRELKYDEYGSPIDNLWKYLLDECGKIESFNTIYEAREYQDSHFKELKSNFFFIFEKI